LQKGKEAVSVILFRGVTRSIPRIQLALKYQKFLHDQMLLWLPYVAQSIVSPEIFAHMMEIFNGFELHFSPESDNDLMLLARGPTTIS
jgi:hypothetical protein